ncbi:hypothetical protein Mgra_00007582, partial [Meloidogyne graminicola]
MPQNLTNTTMNILNLLVLPQSTNESFSSFIFSYLKKQQLFNNSNNIYLN